MPMKNMGVQMPREDQEPQNKPQFKPRAGAVKAAFKEVSDNPPKVLAKTKKKSGAKQSRKQAIAIALSKARKA